MHRNEEAQIRHLFDENWYRSSVTDAELGEADPLLHYFQHGAGEGRDPHPLFDTSFYLKDNPDVAELGVNPLFHYVHYGAREGRDPHPLFKSRFYLQNNPDVAERGLNPLVHYLEIGDAEGRPPNPLFLPAEYRRVMGGARFRNALVDYLQSDVFEGIEPALSDSPAFVDEFRSLLAEIWKRADPQIVVDAVDRIISYDTDGGRGRLFAGARSALLRLKADFLLRCANVSGSVEAAKHSIALNPDSEAAWLTLVRCVGDLRKTDQNNRDFVLIITCEKYFDRALRLYEKLDSRELTVRMVLGVDAKVGEHPSAVKVAAGDTYEHLAEKVRLALTHVFENENVGSVIKLDDDIEIDDIQRFLRQLIMVARNPDVHYAGAPVRHASRDHHFNKCGDPLVNRTPLGRRFSTPYANGPFYYLSREALSRYYRYVHAYPAEIAGYWSYEDIFLGQVMRAEAIPFTPLDMTMFSVRWS